jgi:hypothetical protein
VHRQPSRWRNLAIAILCFVISPIAIYAGLNASGIPPKHLLQRADGVIDWTDKGKYSASFTLSGQSAKFIYLFKGGGASAVTLGLERGKNFETSILFDPNDSAGPIWSDDKAFPVYELRVADSVIRSHESVDEKWRSSNRNWLWLGLLFAALGVGLATAGLRRAI